MASDQVVMTVLKAARPTFRNAHDKVVFAVHSAFLASGFSLLAVGPATKSDDLSSFVEEVGIDEWNTIEDEYGFLYFKEEKGKRMRVLVKAHSIGDILPMDIVDLQEQKEPIHLEINVNDYVEEREAQPKNYGEIYKNFKGLVEVVNSAILKKLEGTKPVEMNSSSSESRRTPVGSLHPESYDRPGGSGYPPTSEGVVYPPIPPSGYSDLYPGPGAGFYPNRGTRGDGSMLIGPHDPRFFPSGGWPSGGSGFPGGMPGQIPGSRFDPIGPPDVPGFEPSRFRRPQHPGGSNHPDLEFFRRSDDNDFV